MKRWCCLWGVTGLLVFLTGCQTNIEQVKPVQKPVVEVVPKKEDLATHQNFMLIQIEKSVFPQNQGVYDVVNHQVTIVKQYIPEKNPNVLSNSDFNAKGIMMEDQIHQDVSKTFPGVVYKANPYQVYEIKLKQVRIELTKTGFILHAETGYTADFQFVDAQETKVKDENGVIYEIQYGD